ncbi:hypothetical protein GWO43_16160 [candidate division KSB1 bacterium]|nr:hypothetical protein [candidate division KSB1 bacterium]NIV68768.1 hypothetical protein [Phycisphaerae bacterium]NIS25485.1 hypothetical protein [candidate division KSB1 bacterium]NIT72378.1 hypothetical protein [candidate division KSB1 bacterium]NIU26162.1 hypothetical protein [candidate division KSB1 bacterium]
MPKPIETLDQVSRIRRIPKRSRYNHGEYMPVREVPEREFNRIVNSLERLIRLNKKD